MYKVVLAAALIGSICLLTVNAQDLPIPYQYQYTVTDPEAFGGPLDFGHQEARDELTTTGQYTVLLPDGRIQTVRYQVAGEDGGYVAEVSYS